MKAKLSSLMLKILADPKAREQLNEALVPGRENERRQVEIEGKLYNVTFGEVEVPTEDHYTIVSRKLAKVGISLDCWSPLEISDNEESRATGWMAQVIINAAMNGDYDDDVH